MNQRRGIKILPWLLLATAFAGSQDRKTTRSKRNKIPFREYHDGVAPEGSREYSRVIYGVFISRDGALKSEINFRISSSKNEGEIFPWNIKNRFSIFENGLLRKNIRFSFQHVCLEYRIGSFQFKNGLIMAQNLERYRISHDNRKISDFKNGYRCSKFLTIF